jgi:energy-coupling factor transport system permease protein
MKSFYLDRETLFHKLHPVTKLTGLAMLLFLFLVFSHPFYLLILYALTLLALLASRSLGNISRVWILLLVLGAMSFILWSLLFAGESSRHLERQGGVTKESFLFGAGMALRLTGMLLCGLLFASTTRMEELAYALRKMGLPGPAAFALTLACRLVPTFACAAETISQAQKARGSDIGEGSLLAKMKKYIPLLVPTFIYAVRSTESISVALEARGFSAHEERTSYLEFRFRLADWFFLTCGVILCVISLYLRLRGCGEIV